MKGGVPETLVFKRFSKILGVKQESNTRAQESPKRAPREPQESPRQPETAPREPGEVAEDANRRSRGSP